MIETKEEKNLPLAGPNDVYRRLGRVIHCSDPRLRSTAAPCHIEMMVNPEVQMGCDGSKLVAVVSKEAGGSPNSDGGLNE
jgi:hypothetical protein